MAVQTKKQGFGSVLLDNDARYLEFLNSAIISHADPEATVSIVKIDDSFKVAIKPSQNEFKSHIISNLLTAHHLMEMKIIFSSSLAKQTTIYYTLNF